MIKNDTDYKLNINISTDAIGLRIDKWLVKKYEPMPYIVIAKLMRKGLIRLNGKKIKGNEQFQVNDILTIPKNLGAKNDLYERLDPNTEKKYQYSSKELKEFKSWIIDDQPDYVIINKPSGIATQGGTSLIRHLDEWAKAYFHKENIRPRLVHRLDKDTSGIMILAKTDEAARILSSHFKNQTIQKLYIALVKGILPRDQDTISLAIKKCMTNDLEKMEIHPQGQAAITKYKVLSHTDNTVSCVGLCPLTGRTHQLRVHMKSCDAPIIGDVKYGGKDARVSKIPSMLYLHAYSIRFLWNGDVVQYYGSFPEHFLKGLSYFGVDKKEILTKGLEFLNTVNS